jgi:DNA-directed RNA polymerase subunit RPC12/RpoP
MELPTCLRCKKWFLSMSTNQYCPKCRPLAKMEDNQKRMGDMHENYMRSEISNWVNQYPEIGRWSQPTDPGSLRWFHHNAHQYVAAKNLENSGRYEEAARLLEGLGMWSEAGIVRKKGNVQVVRHLNVDVNELLEKLKSGGLVTVYKCPNCGGSIKISGTTSADKLSKCEYCGTVLRTDDLVNFIKDILS